MAILPATCLDVNVLKSLTVSWLSDKKNKRIRFDVNRSFYIRGQKLKILAINEEFVYLWIRLNPPGRIYHLPKLGDDSIKLKSPLLKPHKNYFCLGYYLSIIIHWF